jgi:hypothetical protein
MVSGNLEGDLDTCRRLATNGYEYGPGSGNKQESRLDRMQQVCLKAHNTVCGSIPSLFMRETNVVRLTSMSAAAPLGPATRPFVIFR